MSTSGTQAAAPFHHEVRDDVGSKTGMWLFLFTELLLFGGLFVVYAVYRHEFMDAFHHAAEELNVTMGVINTLVLLTSSLTMVLSVNALQRNKVGQSLGYLWATIGFSFVFLIIKFFEWSAKYHHGIFPGQEHLHEMPAGEGMFFNLYFMMTGLHGIHVVIGIIVMTVVGLRVKAGLVNNDRYHQLEYTGLYWHLVDLIWVFLLPLFYLTN